MTALYFNDLRLANRERVGVFTNSKGEVAHKRSDGSDWTPAMWFLAAFGEMGEAAQQLYWRSTGHISEASYQEEIGKEIPDIQIYLDLFAQRALDLAAEQPGPAMVLLRLISELGTYANAYKKFVRGDFDEAQLLSVAIPALARAQNGLSQLIKRASEPHLGVTEVAHETGVDLGEATRSKFNAVSERIGRPEMRI